MSGKRDRKYKSKKDVLIKKSREAMLAAVQVFNTPLIKFKSESFVVLAVIAWTYLLHAFYERLGIDYSYYKLNGRRKQYFRTDYGAIKKWELSKCINASESPLDMPMRKNLEFIIGLRNEVEHQKTNELDYAVSAKLQACAINYNACISEWFGKKYAVDNELIMSIQFSGVDPIKQRELSKMKGLSDNVYNFISDFEQQLTPEVLANKEYSYKIMYIPITANHRGQADSVIEFVKVSEEIADQVKNIVMIKESEKKKYLPSQIVSIIKDKGYKKFNLTTHARLWQNNGNSLKTPQYGCVVAGKSWYWYESWLKYVLQVCENNKEEFGYSDAQ